MWNLVECEQGRSHMQYSIRRTANFWLKVLRTIKRVLSAQGFLIIGIAGTGQGIDFSTVRRLSAVLGSRAGYGLRALHKFH